MPLIVAGPVGQDAHDGGPHPERPARVNAVMDGIGDLRLGTDLVQVAPVRPTGEQLRRVHTPVYLDELELFAHHGGGSLDPDTFVTDDSWDTAMQAAGAGLAALDALAERGDGSAFVVARPPGHHAERERGMGFCLVNSIAVSAAELVARGNRVLVLDWDVHHGNGTQSIFWDDPDVLYVSTHQWPLYPGTGRPDETGGADAPGSTVNVPLPPGATGDVVRAALDEVAAPVVSAFAPDWVLVSCGFDAHRADPLAELALSSADFGALAEVAVGLAPASGRVVLFLEGGYDLPAVRRSAAATVAGLLGDPYRSEEPTMGGPGLDVVRAAGVLRERSLGVTR